MPASNGATRGGGGSLSPTRVPGSHQRPVSFGMRRIAQIDDHQELVVVLVVRGEVLGAGREIGVLTIGEPQIVHAARMRSRGVEIRQLLGMRGIGDVVGVHAGMGLSGLLDLVRHRQRGAGQAERIAAHELRLDRKLGDDLGILGLGHVDRAEAHRRRLMGEEQHALAVGVLPQRQPLAALAHAVQVAVADDLHVAGFRHRRDRIGVCHSCRYRQQRAKDQRLKSGLLHRSLPRGRRCQATPQGGATSMLVAAALARRTRARSNVAKRCAAWLDARCSASAKSEILPHQVQRCRNRNGVLATDLRQGDECCEGVRDFAG